MNKQQAVAYFQQYIAPHLCDLSPTTLRTTWNDFTDGLSKSGSPAAYDWMCPKCFHIRGGRYKTGN